MQNVKVNGSNVELKELIVAQKQEAEKEDEAFIDVIKSIEPFL